MDKAGVHCRRKGDARAERSDELSSSNKGLLRTMRDYEDVVEMAGRPLREKGFPYNGPGSRERETATVERKGKTSVRDKERERKSRKPSKFRCFENSLEGSGFDLRRGQMMTRCW